MYAIILAKFVPCIPRILQMIIALILKAAPVVIAVRIIVIKV